MVLAVKRHQFVLTQAECQLYRLLRELEDDCKDEFSEIFKDGNLPKLFVDIVSSA